MNYAELINNITRMVQAGNLLAAARYYADSTGRSLNTGLVLVFDIHRALKHFEKCD